MRLSHARACADGVEAPGTQALKAHVKLDQATGDRLYQRLSRLKLVEAVDEIPCHVADLHGIDKLAPTDGLGREPDRLRIDVGRGQVVVSSDLCDRLRRLVDATAVSAVLKKC